METSELHIGSWRRNTMSTVTVNLVNVSKAGELAGIDVHAASLPWVGVLCFATPAV